MLGIFQGLFQKFGMSFLSDRTIQAIGARIIHPFRPDRVGTGAYELSLHLGSRASGNGHTLDDACLKIPPGQFAYLFTKERVTIPNHLLGFISIKSSNKWKGLINVSGFHVDPGYNGALKFAVYNAGSRDIFLEFGEPAFQLWLAEFDQPATAYSKAGCDGITCADRSELSGDVHSPASLDRRVTSLERWNKMVLNIIIITGVLAGIIGAFPTLRRWILSPFDNSGSAVVANDHKQVTTQGASAKASQSPTAPPSPNATKAAWEIATAFSPIAMPMRSVAPYQHPVQSTPAAKPTEYGIPQSAQRQTITPSAAISKP